MLADNDLAELMFASLRIASQAGQAILPLWQQSSSLTVKQKLDRTPVTDADIKAHDIIVAGLQALTPDIPILSEEGHIPDYAVRKLWPCYWLLDPIDGTRGFIRHSKEFSVNIALISQGVAVIGVIYAPVFEVAYYAYQGGGAHQQLMSQPSEPALLLKASTRNAAAVCRIILGQYHRFDWLNEILPHDYPYEVLRLNSSLKFARLAKGEADVYPRYGPTCEWDTAAGQCILEEAGGCVVDLKGAVLQYNTKASLLNPNFLAIGDPQSLSEWLEFLQTEKRK